MYLSRLLFISLFLSFSFKTSASTICYFSLNNEKEFHEMKRFTTQLNRFSKRKIKVVEFLTENGDVESAFKKMTMSGVKCDGLVISGHHTGSFGGKRAMAV